MFGMFPFLFNGNNNSSNNNNNNNNNNNSMIDMGLFNNLFDDSFINNVIDQIMSSDMIDSLAEEMLQDDYDINFKDYGDYYLIKGYLPGLTPKDICIDFEKNKAILTIKKKHVYSNGRNAVMTVIQTGGNLVKNFYIEEVDVTKLSASFNNNVLIITMPKIKKVSDLTVSNEVSTNPEIIDVDNYKVE